MSATLSPADFAAFYRAVHGFEPFQWQVDLLDEIVAGGEWPNLIDLPTGSGKTSVLDIGLFHLALEAQSEPSYRRASLRLAFVVDRRIVVDQVADRAKLLTEALTDGRAEVCNVMAGALRSLSEDGPPLRSSALRGGIVRDELWAKRPDVPAILSSTVDQVGSRLLFRGYGISDGMIPIHAGLLANDTLIFLDEVHLSQPFAQTLDMLGRHRRQEGRPVRVVELSATPGEQRGTVFPAEPLRSDDVADPLRSRLVASKPCRLEAVKVPKDRAKADVAFTKAVVGEVRKVVKKKPGHLVGVVVNRVDTARRVYNGLAAVEGIEAVLLTGRMRPIDRDAVLAENADRWMDRDQRSGVTEVVVATQCIEAGADFDFDVLVTESASIDALRQRFGRVDRRGAVHATGEPLESVILNRGANPVFDDPIYGPSLGETWSWLCQLDAVDFGIERLPQSPVECVAGRPDAPLLTKLHLESFAQTSPRPHVDHDPARWLHGPDSDSPSISVLWRCELNDLLGSNGVVEKTDDESALVQPAIEAEATARLTFFPPSALETVDLPIWAARTWLAGSSTTSAGEAPSFGDVGPTPPPDTINLSKGRQVLVWTDRAAVLRSVAKLAPGDIVVLPTTAPGIGSHGNWDPQAADRVDDVAAEASQRSRGRALLRLGAWAGEESLEREAFAQLVAANAEEVLNDRAIRQIVGEVFAESPFGRPGTTVVARFADPGRPKPDSADDDQPSVPSPIFIGIAGPADRRPELFDVGDVGDRPSFTAQPVGLRDHLAGVGDVAAGFARRLGFDDDLVSDLALAGRIHDVGKADPRFQRWLKDGADPSAVGTELLAKSPISSRNWAAMREARGRSGYPAGMRHELLSLALAQSDESLWSTAVDHDLVAHLVLSHHGYCRPLPPAVSDDDPLVVEVEIEGSRLSTCSETGLTHVGSGVVDRFWRLVDRYDPYGIAYLEAVLRLADHWRSALEAAGKAAGSVKGGAA